MAATWTCEITVTNLAQRIVSIRATRTDGEDVRTYYREKVRVDTQDLAGLRDKLVAGFRKHYEVEVANEQAAAAVIGDWEAGLVAALNAKET